MMRFDLLLRRALSNAECVAEQLLPGLISAPARMPLATVIADLKEIINGRTDRFDLLCVQCGCSEAYLRMASEHLERVLGGKCMFCGNALPEEVTAKTQEKAS